MGEREGVMTVGYRERVEAGYIPITRGVRRGKDTINEGDTCLYCTFVFLGIIIKCHPLLSCRDLLYNIS